MYTTDLKFFTNEPDRDLYNRFSAILKSNTQFFDVLVGYFRSSGFFNMYEALEQVEKIRILVGLNVDLFTVKIIDLANDEYTPVPVSAKQGKEILEAEIEQEFAEAEATSKVEKGVRVFVDWLKNGKLEMRMYTKSPIHAKVYIMRKDPVKVPDMFGSVITGSSNFSVAGLKNNLEFNVELKDTPDVKFALEHFEKLWDDGIDIRNAYIEAVEKKTWMRDDITPYEMYLKTVYEFFKEEINADKETIETLLPDDYMRLQYQFDAVTQAKKKLEAYNGVFISDVVGLGKTYICALLAKSFKRNTRKLFVCPPVLKNYWESVLKDFDVSRCDVESLGKLDHIIEKGADKYDYVFVDEAHRFRNSDTESFALLHEICRGKKVVLISATPINNYTSDIENQIYLFQPKQSGNINGIKNIEGFFRGLNSKLTTKVKGSPEYMSQLRENSEIIRDKLIREVMIRRTRGEVQKYYAADLEAQGLKFPKAGSPEKIVYEFDEITDKAFCETIAAIKEFKYARYTPLLYLKDKDKFAQMIIGQRNMGGFMKGILVKRLESSFYAFSKTLGRFIESYEQFINMYEGGKVYISKKVNVYDLLDDGNDNGLKKLFYHIEQKDVLAFDSKDFQPKLIRDLRSDLTQLQYLRDMWAEVTVDPKLAEFRNQLSNNKIVKGKKIIVFTESKETAEYLFTNLKDLYGSRIVYFSGQSSDTLKTVIEDSFNPKNKDKNNDKYDLLITTDVLAEGINLHRANILVNYDLPWNPTRIMQRVGRINRVGTEHDRIYVFNFFPTAQSAKQMPLEDRILEKLQSFHDTLGEDYKYLSDAEEVSAQNLFADLSKNLDDEDGESTNPELAYLALIRGIRDTNSELFNKIKRLPLNAKTAKKDAQSNHDYTITFLRKGALKSFFVTDADETETKQLSFMDAIKMIECSENEPKLAVAGEYYDHLKKNSKAFDDMLVAEEEVTVEKTMVTGNDKKVITALKALKSAATLTDIEDDRIDTVIKRCENGELPAKITKSIVKELGLTHSDPIELYHAIINLIPDTYFNETDILKSVVNGEKEIILSCYICGGKL